MAGYTRQSTYTNGDVITAAHTNDEFDQLETTFDNSSGHSHDGSAGEGPVIKLIGDPGNAPVNKVEVDTANNRVGFYIDVSSVSTEQVRVEDGLIAPVTTNDVDLGTSSLQFKDLYLDGTATIDGLAMPTTTVTDILDEDNMASDSATALATQQSIKAYVDTQLTAEDLDFQGDSGGALSVDLDSQTLTIAGGTGIDTTGSGQTLTIDIDSTVATLADTQTLTNKTLTSAVLNGTISGTSIKDEDDMLSDSADHLATQQSIKAYVDSQITANNELDELTDVTITSVADNEVLAYDSTSSEWINQTAAEAGLATLTGTETLTNKTLTSAVLNTGVSGTAVLDEDNMASDSDTQLATQQSIKAYVDTEVAGVTAATGNELENVVEDTTPQLGGDLDTNGNSIVLPDSSGTADRIKLGDTTDTSIYHQGTTTFIQTTTGNTTVVDTASLAVKFGSEFTATFTGNDSVDLYYDNSKKFETTTDGVTVTGKAVADELDVDNITINGNTISSTDTNGDITLDPNGTGNVLLGNFEFDVDQTVGAGQDNYVLTYDNAAGTISLEAAASSGLADIVDDTTPQLGGELDSNGNDIKLADDDNLIIGTDSDALLFHNSATNRTNLATDGMLIKNKAGTSSIIDFTASGLEIFYNNDPVLTVGQDAVFVDNFLAVENRGTIGMYETTANGTNYIGFKAPSSVTATTVFTMPDGDGTNGQSLTTDGSGTLSWATPSAAGDGDGLAFAIALG